MAEALWKQVEAEPESGTSTRQGAPRITLAMVAAAAAVSGLKFTDADVRVMLEALESNLSAYQDIRLVPLSNRVPPALQFSAMLPGRTFRGSTRRSPLDLPIPANLAVPVTRAELAFHSVTELAALIRARRVTSTELTQLYLDRMRRYNGALNCVVTMTGERALRQAAEADRQIAAGHYRGPLHGIPYGVKDILSVAGYPTTWGAKVFKDRVIDTTATVVQRLDAAGAILIAKLSMGELGLNDIWYGGQTRNPWRPAEGSSGSSSGSAVATAAGLVGFAIGAETMGSIVTPATRNGVTGLRPTFGRVSRHGAMTLCWSLDKIGPMARSIEDCAIVLEAIAGPDGVDPTVASVPYAWRPDRPLSNVRVGYFKTAFDAARPGKVRDDLALRALRDLGIPVVPIELPTGLPVNALLIIRVEAAAALDEIARSGALNGLEEQHVGAWPAFMRSGRLVPAVDYIQANRIRTLLMQRMEAVFDKVDVFLAPTFGVMPLTNLTGHPCAVMPNGFNDEGIPASISFIGRLFGESELCTVARAWQEATGWNRRHPALFVED